VDSATAAICISHIQYLTATCSTWASSRRWRTATERLLIVGRDQSAGQVPIDVTASGVDVLITGSYKWAVQHLRRRGLLPQPHPAQRVPAAAGGLAQHRAPLVP